MPSYNHNYSRYCHQIAPPVPIFAPLVPRIAPSHLILRKAPIQQNLQKIIDGDSHHSASSN